MLVTDFKGSEATEGLISCSVGLCWGGFGESREGSIMSRSRDPDERIRCMTFASVYPHYVAKIESKGRTMEELHRVIQWLTGFGDDMIQKCIDEKMTFEQFFQHATLNPNAVLIKGVICGHRVEDIENPLTQKVRYMDKLVNDLAKGRRIERMLPQGESSSLK